MQNTCENFTVTSSQVLPQSRSSFLINHLGLKAFKFEKQIYQWCDYLCPDYDGGYWEFYALSNGGFYMSPYIDKNMSLEVSGNGYLGSLNSQTVGIIVTLFALSSLAFTNYMKTDIFADKYQLLLDFADTHPNSADIFAAID